jgi:hypothetical protein
MPDTPKIKVTRCGTSNSLEVLKKCKEELENMTQEEFDEKMKKLEKEHPEIFDDETYKNNSGFVILPDLEDGILFSDEYIICSAIYFNDGKKHGNQPKNIDIGFVICGRRHPDCYGVLEVFMSLDEFFSQNKIEEIQGFLTSENKFLNRQDAYVVAKKCGQIIGSEDDKHTSCLISEDLY